LILIEVRVQHGGSLVEEGSRQRKQQMQKPKAEMCLSCSRKKQRNYGGFFSVEEISKGQATLGFSSKGRK
jgi:hypothetical protein